MQKTTLDRVRNWIYYYKWYVVLGALLLVFALRYIAGILGVASPRPDLQAAYVGRHVLSEETVLQLQELLAERAGDYNDDGRVLVQVRQYLTSDEGGAAEAQQNAAAAEISLVGDIDGCESYLFLLEDPEQFQIEWQILADENGNPPDPADYSVDKKVLPLTDLLPDLGSIAAETDRETLSLLMIGRRCFYTEKTCENAESLAGLWNSMTGNTLSSPDANGKITVGNSVLAPYTIGDLALSEYNEALAANGFYYATWTSGEPSSITNSDGEAALLYPLQLYMVTYEGTDPSDAGSKAAGWLAAARKNYQITGESSFSAEGREYVILEYAFPDASAPYACGVSAFLTSESSTALCAELLSVEAEEGSGSLRALLEAFLAGIS